MSGIMQKLASGAISATGGYHLTVKSPKRATLMSIDIGNTTAAPLSCTIHIVPSGVTPSAATTLFPTVSIDGYSMLQWTGTQVMDEGDSIYAIGSGAGLTFHVSGEMFIAALR